MRGNLAGIALRHLSNHFAEALCLRTGINLTRPSQVYININRACTCKCAMCRQWQLPEPDALATEQWFSILEDLAQWPGKGTKVNFTGGEPFLREDFVSILEKACLLGLVAGVVTNGTLVTQSIARQVTQMGVYNVNISLDSLHAEVHDGLRGLQGATVRALGAIDHLLGAKREANTTTNIILKTIIMRANVDSVSELVAFTEKKGLAGIFFQPIIQPIGEKPDHKWHEQSELWPDYQTVKPAIDSLIDLRRHGAPILNTEAHIMAMKSYFRDPLAKAQRKCAIGLSNLDIWYNGKMAPLCGELPGLASPGDLSQSSAKQLWTGRIAHEQRQKTLSCKMQCTLTCSYGRSLWEKTSLLLRMNRRGH